MLVYCPGTALEPRLPMSNHAGLSCSYGGKPNFLHAGDHVHLGPGVSATRQTNPAVDLHHLPRIDLVLLSHYHGDHFDQKVEASLRRDLPIITTPHAHKQLTGKSADSFTNVTALDHFESTAVKINSNESQGRHQIRVTGMPGKHVPSHSIVDSLNSLVQAIPPTNGWMVELGGVDPNDAEKFTCGYRIYITGDTLLVDELKKIPELYRNERIDLMLAHLGGTTVPSPSLGPLALMVTMDAKQGVQLIRLIQPDLTIPIHYDDYDVFASPLKDFKAEIEMAGLQDKVVYLDRGDKFGFTVREA
ncbi:hypothetical protein N7539_004292 [Penicillium diatomitis]|uniref:Metallo-beta-lactamase domain-containing protein n=1 Tax=Penicillium diatomitis TaxID=2819901 RepID=A0A9X0BYN3_9EURO|nr:uncharacterized protein N7539_004292 [Penicillium diatomitis]KAJ5489402.1 hypothetical protein N7539_004292 [Penicillium diatomitis]